MKNMKRWHLLRFKERKVARLLIGIGGDKYRHSYELDYNLNFCFND